MILSERTQTQTTTSVFDSIYMNLSKIGKSIETGSKSEVARDLGEKQQGVTANRHAVSGKENGNERTRVVNSMDIPSYFQRVTS